MTKHQLNQLIQRLYEREHDMPLDTEVLKCLALLQVASTLERILDTLPEAGRGV